MALTGAEGSIYSREFLDITRPLYDMHMGTENMAGMLYNFIRFTKPKHVLEVGAGYTSVWILQALKDNFKEIQVYKELRRQDRAHINGTPWSVDRYFEEEEASNEIGTLHCVDNLEHAHTTADLVREAAEKLNMTGHLKMHYEDIFDMTSSSFSSGDPDFKFDFIWADFGAGDRLEEFFDRYWSMVSGKGGYTLVHSSLTNKMTRTWIEKMKRCQRYSEEAHEMSTIDKMNSVDKKDNDKETLSKNHTDLDGDGHNGNNTENIDILKNNINDDKNDKNDINDNAIVKKDDDDDDDLGILGSDIEDLGLDSDEDEEVESENETSVDDHSLARYGRFTILSMLEPHKLFQNSFTMFQKRGPGYDEPVYTVFP